MAHISLENVSLSFDTNPNLIRRLANRFRGRSFPLSRSVMDNICLSIVEGDRIALIGRNGAGKSTFLRLLADIYTPDSGTIERQGDVTGLFNLSLGTRRELTGRQNLIIRNLIQGRTYAEIQEHMQSMIDFADIGHHLDQPMGTYSQGTGVRLVFAAATEFEPDILLLDEWLGVGDMGFRQKSETRMQELVERSGIIVFATHNEGISRKVCNKAVWLDSGQMRMFGDIDSVWENYKQDVAENPNNSVR